MDEDNKNKTQNGEQNTNNNEDRPHVRIFGADVDNGASTSGNTNAGSQGTMSRDEWHAKKQEWKQKHREQKQQQQRMQRRQDWSTNHHSEGYFAGLLLLLVGIVALSYTLGFISKSFWYAIEPFWPILLILWGASIVLGRHWFSRFILFIFTLAFFAIVIFYGLVRTDSPYVNGVSPNVRSQINNMYPQQ